MHGLKSLLKRTPLYGLVRRYRMRRAIPPWSDRERAMLRFYRQFVHAGDAFFDVGANMGNRSRVFLRLGVPVVAVEPEPRCADFLEAAYGGCLTRLKVIRAALGEVDGEAEMLVSDASVLSSLSAEWVAAVQQSGRFEGCTWDRRRVVQMTTLDRLIDRFGVPAFIKIDVEGYEYHVVRGLSRPVGALSIEFTPELLDATFRCLRHLSGLGSVEVNYGLGEIPELILPEWVTSDELASILATFRGDIRVFGDVYVRFV